MERAKIINLPNPQDAALIRDVLSDYLRNIPEKDQNQTLYWSVENVARISQTLLYASENLANRVIRLRRDVIIELNTKMPINGTQTT